MFRSASLLTAFLLLASAAFAHEGHGDPAHQHGATHYVVNPSHAMPIGLTATTVLGLGLALRRSMQRVPPLDKR